MVRSRSARVVGGGNMAPLMLSRRALSSLKGSPETHRFRDTKNSRISGEREREPSEALCKDCADFGCNSSKFSYSAVGWCAHSVRGGVRSPTPGNCFSLRTIYRQRPADPARRLYHLRVGDGCLRPERLSAE